MILYILINFGTVYVIIDHYHRHHDTKRLGIGTLVKMIFSHFCTCTPVLDKNCNIYQKGMVRTILSLSKMK